MAAAATLLFLHGNGFCKQAWQPVVQRVTRALAAPVACEAFSLPLHNEKHDPAAHETARVYYQAGDPAAPRVSASTNAWATEWPAAIFPSVLDARQRADAARRPLIGVGHSMGAALLWAVEVQHPGTFDGLVLFEPVFGEFTPAYTKSIDFLVRITIERQSHWPSKAAAREYFESFANFASWDRESLSGWIDGAVVDARDGNGAVLANHPLTEAGVYTGPRLLLDEDELARPKCRVAIHSGVKSRLFDVDLFREIAARHPQVYSVALPMDDVGHLMVFEDPAASAAAIVADVEQFMLPLPLASHL